MREEEPALSSQDTGVRKKIRDVSGKMERGLEGVRKFGKVGI